MSQLQRQRHRRFDDLRRARSHYQRMQLVDEIYFLTRLIRTFRSIK